MIRGNKKKEKKFVRYADVEYIYKRYRELPESGEYLYDYKLEGINENIK